MGAWGTGLFADDIALDIKDEYIKHFREGKTPEEITALLKKTFLSGGDDDFFWVCLAVTQWDHGHLTSEVKERALRSLPCLWEPGLWERPADVTKRKALGERVKEKLESPQPTAKKPPKFRAKKSKWKVGEIYSFQFDDCSDPKKSSYLRQYAEFSFKYGAFCVVGMELVESKERGGVLDEWPVVMVYDSITDKMPTQEELEVCPMITFQSGCKGNFCSTMRGHTPEKWMISRSNIQYVGTTCRFDGIKLPLCHGLEVLCWDFRQFLGDARLCGWPHVTREDGTLL